MIQEAHSPFAAWESFYVIVGTSAAALTAIQFVVMTLVREARGGAGSGEIGAFATPTIVHFCAALYVAAVLSAPWPDLSTPSIVIGAGGLAGVVYVAVVTWKATHQTGYKMVAEDWTWHVALPFVAYLGQILAATMLSRRTLFALFVIAGSALLLVYIGIHNAWDTTTYVAFTQRQSETVPGPGSSSGPAPSPAADAT